MTYTDLDDIPMLAVANDELQGPVGTTATCPNCGQRHPVVYGERLVRDPVTGVETREPSNLIAAVRCGDKLFLVGVGGRLLPPRDKEGKP